MFNYFIYYFHLYVNFVYDTPTQDIISNEKLTLELNVHSPTSKTSNVISIYFICN